MNICRSIIDIQRSANETLAAVLGLLPKAIGKIRRPVDWCFRRTREVDASKE
jgi:hypothetical protein